MEVWHRILEKVIFLMYRVIENMTNSYYNGCIQGGLDYGKWRINE